jgi:F0F1-type ATP synthase membrane subunit b/b'
MAFTATRLQLHEGIAIKDGVVPAVERLRLVETRDLIEQMLQRARDDAASLISEAREEAQQIIEGAVQERELLQVKTQEQAELLLGQINREWRRIVDSLEPTVVSIARMAIEQVCAESSLSERLDAATRAAVRELPEKPVRLHVSRGNRSKLTDSIGAEMDVVEDPDLSPDCVRVEGVYGTCEVNFDLAKTSVTNCLTSWSVRALELSKKTLPTTAPWS